MEVGATFAGELWAYPVFAESFGPTAGDLVIIVLVSWLALKIKIKTTFDTHEDNVVCYSVIARSCVRPAFARALGAENFDGRYGVVCTPQSVFFVFVFFMQLAQRL